MIWIYRILSLEFIYILTRCCFAFFNRHALRDLPSTDVFLAFFDGLRFDLCAIATLNAPIMLFDSIRALKAYENIPEKLKHFQKVFVYALFLIANIPFLIWGFIDSKMYAFTGRRTTPDSFGIKKDIGDQAFGVVLQYWEISLLSAITFAGLMYLSWERQHKVTVKNRTFKGKATTGFLFILISVLAIRGGLQTRPLSPTHGFKWQPTVLGSFVLNTPFTLLKSNTSTEITRIDDFKSMTEVRKILEIDHTVESVPLVGKGKNFVVIVVESLASEYVGYLNNGKGYTPFLDSLAKSSITFQDSFASGRRSIDAIPAIFGGVPAWRDQPFIISSYASNEILALPRELSSLGYHSMFFHGASNGSMHFDVFAKMVGFSEYIGKNEFPDPDQYDGQWGIYDEPFLKFALEKIANTAEPFFAGIFTISSHNPFKIPDIYKNKFPHGTLPIHESIGYTDYALSVFFKLASSEPWFHNTVFVITGDHTSLSDKSQYQNFAGRFRVPILIFDTTGSLPRIDSTKVATHVDIAPTILELVGKTPNPQVLFGGPLFARNWKGRFIQEENGSWYYRDNEIQYFLDESNQVKIFGLDDDFWQRPLNQKDDQNFQERIDTLKASRQYFINGLLDNSWRR